MNWKWRIRKRASERACIRKKLNFVTFPFFSNNSNGNNDDDDDEYAWLCKVVIHLENAGSNQCSSGECEAHAERRTIQIYYISMCLRSVFVVCYAMHCTASANVRNEKVRTSNVGNTLYELSKGKRCCNIEWNEEWTVIIHQNDERMEWKKKTELY